MDSNIKKYLATIGSRGGKKSRRKLSPTAARKMVKVREARRAFKRYYALCFWSYDPNTSIQLGDEAWVAAQLMKHGNREAWDFAKRLCR